MERKTKIDYQPGTQELTVIRDFEIPVDLLFKAYVIPEIVEQWMGTKVMKLENKIHGSWHFITTDPAGNKHGFNGVIHEYVPDQKITRTFEMENSGFPVQLEFLEFEALTEEKSKLNMKIIFRSVTDRDNMLKLPFAMGINMAHNRLEGIFKQL